jgi:EAL domain-containing protein (putative c-di-GMP-specific phosphodiesterase class I)
MQNAATTVRMLNALRDLGVQLAVDDFGTGYSSLSYLQQFPVQALKVDRSFVARLDEETQDSAGSAAIVRAVVSLAAGLGLRTVAEGIETPGQLAAVMELGCDLGQGYFLGRPAPARNIPLVVPGGVVMPGEYSDL